MKETYVKKGKSTFFSILILSFSLVLLCIIEYTADCREVRDGVLRLHILADSDSEEDQSVKLLVRDALLSSGAAIFDGSVCADDAVEKISPEISFLEETANSVLRENGFDYNAKVSITREYFATRQYDSKTLPAGEYTALKVILGEGDGHNWWCVMFPPLCLPAASDTEEEYCVFDEDGRRVVSGSGQYAVRFKIAEWWEEIKERLFN
ncbi:MAG: stage II sporulation protein R [Clostridia bacterium]|nr:stage II sporulation protein R [Clostridia bacterium]